MANDDWGSGKHFDAFYFDSSAPGHDASILVCSPGLETLDITVRSGMDPRALSRIMRAAGRTVKPEHWESRDGGGYEYHSVKHEEVKP